MSNVTLQIGGRSYTVACAAGEEEHISGLGKVIDQKLQALGHAAGQNESRTLLFASLLLADEVHEARSRNPSPVLPFPPAEPPLSEAAPAEDPQIAEQRAQKLEEIAARLEKCAEALEQDPPHA